MIHAVYTYVCVFTKPPVLAGHANYLPTTTDFGCSLSDIYCIYICTVYTQHIDRIPVSIPMNHHPHKIERGKHVVWRFYKSFFFFLLWVFSKACVQRFFFWGSEGLNAKTKTKTKSGGLMTHLPRIDLKAVYVLYSVTHLPNVRIKAPHPLPPTHNREKKIWGRGTLDQRDMHEHDEWLNCLNCLSGLSLSPVNRSTYLGLLRRLRLPVNRALAGFSRKKL